MAHTYTQLYIHFVFAVQGRQSLIQHHISERLYRFITGIVQKRGHTLIAINGRPDHIHILIGLKPDIAPSDLVRDIKSFSANHINQHGWIRGMFQ